VEGNVWGKKMEDWRRCIEEFDRDLFERMKVINWFERTGLILEDELFFKRALGFVILGLPPSWRDLSREWKFRNKERVNAGKLRWYYRHKKERADYCKAHRVERNMRQNEKKRLLRTGTVFSFPSLLTK
jgi:hypothetical protein